MRLGRQLAARAHRGAGVLLPDGRAAAHHRGRRQAAGVPGAARLLPRDLGLGEPLGFLRPWEKLFRGERLGTSAQGVTGDELLLKLSGSVGVGLVALVLALGVGARLRAAPGPLAARPALGSWRTRPRVAFGTPVFIPALLLAPAVVERGTCCPSCARRSSSPCGPASSSAPWSRTRWTRSWPATTCAPRWQGPPAPAPCCGATCCPTCCPRCSTRGAGGHRAARRLLRRRARLRPAVLRPALRARRAAEAGGRRRGGHHRLRLAARRRGPRVELVRLPWIPAPREART